MLAVPFAPQAVAKTAAATTASQPEIASGSAMIVDLNTNKAIYSNHPDCVSDCVYQQINDCDGRAGCTTATG
ncbi:hypothetical protein ACLB1R_04850 [Escherichia coli]